MTLKLKNERKRHDGRKEGRKGQETSNIRKGRRSTNSGENALVSIAT
jgi:hypothetical protein